MGKYIQKFLCLRVRRITAPSILLHFWCFRYPLVPLRRACERFVPNFWHFTLFGACDLRWLPPFSPSPPPFSSLLWIGLCGHISFLWVLIAIVLLFRQCALISPKTCCPQKPNVWPFSCRFHFNFVLSTRTIINMPSKVWLVRIIGVRGNQ